MCNCQYQSVIGLNKKQVVLGQAALIFYPKKSGQISNYFKNSQYFLSSGATDNFQLQTVYLITFIYLSVYSAALFKKSIIGLMAAKDAAIFVTMSFAINSLSANGSLTVNPFIFK